MKTSNDRPAATNEAALASPAENSPGTPVAASEGSVYRAVTETSLAPTHLFDIDIFPNEMLAAITENLEAPEALALIEAYPDLKSRYTSGELDSWKLENHCRNLLHHYDAFDRQQKAEAEQAYQQVLLKLFDPKTGSGEFKRMAELAGRLHAHFSASEIRKLLNTVLSRPPAGLQTGLEELARINLYVCASLCGIVTLGQLARHGVDYSFLLARFPMKREEADAFFRGMGGTRHNSVLHYAIQRKEKEVVTTLLDANPEYIDQLDNLNNTALALTLAKGDLDIFHLLLERGANVNVRNEPGETLLMQLAFRDEFEEEVRPTVSLVVSALLSHGADINLQSPEGYTALMRACDMGNLYMVRLLLENEADVSLKTGDGRDALAIAQAGGYEDIVQLLKNHQRNLTA